MTKFNLILYARLRRVSAIFILFLFTIVFFSIPVFSQVYLDSTASVNDRVADLLSRMTLEEKVGQMVQTERLLDNVNTVIHDHYLGSILSGGGSTPGGNTVQDWISMYNGMQYAALSTRLKVPIIYGVDAVHGHNNVYGATIFPHNIGLGCTRDSALVYRCARATATEVHATGLNWTFSPCVAVPRNIRWGRTYEGFGETPELAELMASAAVAGYQGDSLGTPGRILACSKHYVGDGGTSNGTDQGNTVIDEAGLRAIHLPGYVSAIEAGVGSVMVSFSSWNGVKCHMNKYLVTDLLKGELGFDGFVVSDWDGVHNAGGDYKTQIGVAVNAGIDMFMEPYTPLEFINNLIQLVYSGTVPQSRIDDAVSRILAVKFKMHLFEHPYVSANQADSLGCEAHRAIAREAVRKSLVLLKNSNSMLPLSKQNGKILVAGPKASDIGSQCGGWTISWQGSTGPITTGTTIYDAVKSVRGSQDVVYSSNGATTTSVDLAIIVAGETPYAEGAGDSANPQLSQADLAVIANVKQLNVPYVILLLSGRPLILGNVISDADAFVACWLPGTEGLGITDVLFGDYDFSGKLSHTWPVAVSQEPVNWGDNSYQPLFPYGSGLSYAQNGVHEPANLTFSFYPDPVEDVLTIKSEKFGQIEIRNTEGKIMKEAEMDREILHIRMADLPAGVYFIVFNTGNDSFRQKFVKL